MSNNQMKTLLESIDTINEYSAEYANPKYNRYVLALSKAIKGLNASTDPQKKVFFLDRIIDLATKAKTELDSIQEDFEDATTEPDPMYADHQMMTHDLAGGLNKQKDSYAPTNGGDNPMSLEETKIQAELTALYKL